MQQIESLPGKTFIALEPKGVAERIAASEGCDSAGNSSHTRFLSAGFWVVSSKQVHLVTKPFKAAAQAVHADADPIENGEG